jgi:chromosomal replication initiation ATPase DnaA
MNFLIYKDYQFIPNKILNNNNFGRLSVSMLETGIIKSKINNFSKLKTIDTTYLESEESCIIREINWKIKYRIEKQKDQDSESFSFYVTPMCEDKIIAQIIPDNKKEALKYVCLIESEYKKQPKITQFDVKDYEDLLIKYTDADEKQEIIRLLEDKFNKASGFQKTEKTIENIVLDDGKFKISPIINKFQVYYLYGASGSGKSYIARDIAEGYHTLNPKNGVFLISKSILNR